MAKKKPMPAPEQLADEGGAPEVQAAVEPESAPEPMPEPVVESPVMGLKVMATRFRLVRCGFVFGKTPMTLPLSSLSESDLAIIKNDPQLKTELVKL